jgi:hypothetical protein
MAALDHFSYSRLCYHPGTWGWSFSGIDGDVVGITGISLKGRKHVNGYPIVQVIGGIIYLIVAVLWIRFYFRRVDPWLRERIGRYFDVTLGIAGRGTWKVVESGQGIRGFLIEFLQPLFMIPAVLLPLIIFVVLLMLLGQN